MQEIPNLDRAALKSAFQIPFINSLRAEISRQQALLDKTEKVFLSYYQRLERIDGKNLISKSVNESDWLKSSLYEILEHEFPQRREIPYSEEFSEFIVSSEKYLSSLTKEILIEQSKERFISLDSDSLKIRFLKVFKYLFFRISTWPRKCLNVFRTEKQNISYWKQKVPFQSIAHFYFRQQFAKEGLELFEELQSLKCEALNLLIRIDRDIDKEFQTFLAEEQPNLSQFVMRIKGLSEKENIKRLKQTLKDKLDLWEQSSIESLDHLIEQFKNAVAKVDTLELSRTEFSEQTIEQQKLLLSNSYNRIFHGWRNTFFAQIDDFQVDIELYQIKNTSLKQQFLVQNSCNSRIHSTISDVLGSLEQQIESVKQRISSSSEQALEENIDKQKTLLVKKLEKESIPKTIDAIYNQNLPELLNRLEVKIKESINSMKSKRIIYSNSHYDSPLGKNELTHFNPKELVEIDIYPKLSKQIGELQSQVIKEIETVQRDLKDLSGITNYNLESALNFLEEKKEFDAIVQLCCEGLDRSLSKIEESKAKLLKIEHLIQQKLNLILKEFNKAIVSLTINENITQIRLKIAKAKTLEQTLEYRRKILKNIKSFIPIAYRFITKEANIGVKWFEKGLQKVGLKEEELALTAELSEYLSKTDKAIAALPYVYKRLYQIKALEDDLFFEGRSEELNLLNAAFDNWKKGNYSATLLSGEKGSGASSLVNLFLKNVQGIEMYRHKLDIGIYTENQFIQFFRQILKNETIDSFDSIVKEINSGKSKIIILEDLQHFYLKKINGFEAINLLMELISATAEKTFWLVEITSYTYSYLSRTISIERYFRYNIILKALSHENIINLIVKRHRVSGYKLHFMSDHLNSSEQRKLKGLNPEEKQNALKQRFFQHLNRFAQSNISLALLYWLRSINEVKENIIFIAHNQPFNFEFLNTLNNDSIFTLHSLLLHDSLSVAEHSAVFHQSEKASKRMLMVLVDHALLTQNKERYYLNRLLYRQVVNTLKSKNIIH